MKRYITPSWTINSVYDIQPQDLLKRGYEAAIIDLDNTVIAWNNMNYTEEMADWISRMTQAGVKIYILSNNKVERVAKVAEPLGIPYKAGALKPRRKNFQLALDSLGTSQANTIMIGDQIMTDIIGANRAKMASILVKPIARNDNFYTWANRAIERLALKLVGIKRKGDWGDQLDCGTLPMYRLRGDHSESGS